MLGKREPSRPMTDLQRVQDSLRRFGFTKAVDPSTDGGGIVLTVACAVDLAECDSLTDRMAGGIWRSTPDVRTRLVFDDVQAPDRAAGQLQVETRDFVSDFPEPKLLPFSFIGEGAAR